MPVCGVIGVKTIVWEAYKLFSKKKKRLASYIWLDNQKKVGRCPMQAFISHLDKANVHTSLTLKK